MPPSSPPCVRRLLDLSPLVLPTFDAFCYDAPLPPHVQRRRFLHPREAHDGIRWHLQSGKHTQRRERARRERRWHGDASVGGRQRWMGRFAAGRARVRGWRRRQDRHRASGARQDTLPGWQDHLWDYEH